jgi:hypothetical protein
MLRVLRRLDHRRLVEIALVVDIELAEGILQAKDLALLELRVFPWRMVLASLREDKGGAYLLLQFNNIHHDGSTHSDTNRGGGIGAPNEAR